MTEAEASGILKGLQERLAGKSEEQLAGLQGVYQVHLTGEGGGDYVLHIAEDGARAEAGVAMNPGVTATMAAQDFQAMAEGRLNPMTAFMSGRLSIAGSMGLAMKLASLLA
jgi:putative sterol carrier protein